MYGKNKLTDLRRKYNILKKIELYFKQNLNLTPIIGAELEFYLHNISDINELEKTVKQNFKKEKGKNQYEIDLAPSKNIADYAKLIWDIRNKIIDNAKKYGGEADFSSKPCLDDYGNSMHIHLNFLEDEEVEKYANILCHFIPETIDAFLPDKADYKRLDPRFMAPTHICYGGNNRTVMIRIPDSAPKRIEHRLASANADPYEVIYAILHSIRKGLSTYSKIPKLDKIYGNAFDEQYKLKKLCISSYSKKI